MNLHITPSFIIDRLCKTASVLLFLVITIYTLSLHRKWQLLQSSVSVLSFQSARICARRSGWASLKTWAASPLMSRTQCVSSPRTSRHAPCLTKLAEWRPCGSDVARVIVYSPPRLVSVATPPTSSVCRRPFSVSYFFTLTLKTREIIYVTAPLQRLRL